jgi:EH domain-containing protein 1
LPTKCSIERLVNISPTSEDRALQQRLLEFLVARPEWWSPTLLYFQGALYNKDGIEQATQANATSFFAMSVLSRDDLKQVWAIADAKRQGYLRFTEFVTEMHLVSMAQAGNEITQDNLKREDMSTLDPPVMEGVDEILARSKVVVKRVHLDDNGTTQAQAPSIYHWFGSKSA